MPNDSKTFRIVGQNKEKVDARGILRGKPVYTEDFYPRDALIVKVVHSPYCLLYTSDAADDLLCVDLGGRRIIKKKTRPSTQQ